MNEIQQLEYRLNEQKNKFGLVGAKRARVQEFDDAKFDFSAHINPQDWGIEVNLKTGYNPVRDNRQKIYARVKGINDPLETLVLQVGSGHEVAHWELPVGSGKGCPMDVYWHDKILEGIATGLSKAGKNPEQNLGEKTLKSYIANAFEDTIINPRVKEYFGDFSGQILFWDNEGLRTQEETGQKGFTPLYEAFVKVNLHLFGDKWDKVFLSRHYTDNPEVKKAVEGIITDCNFQENIQDTTPLFNKSTWVKRAENYARAISPLIQEQPPMERISSYDSEQNGAPREEKGKKEPKSGNGIEQKAKTKQGKEEIVYKRYSKGEGQSSNIQSFEQLDLLYQRLAKDIAVKVEAISRDSSMEIAPLNYRSFDPEKDNPLKIKTSKFFLTQDGFNFAYPNQPLTIDFKQKVQRKSFPNFKMVLIDDSGSMAEGINGSEGGKNFIPFGDNSKYHFALLGYYGIENFLQKQGIAPYINHGVSVFSSQTRFKTGTYQDLVETRKLLLNPSWGGTSLDVKTLEKALQDEGSFFLSISDGQVENWNSEKDEIKKLIDKNYFAHIQLGEKTNMSSDFESWGKVVYYINSGEDLSKLMVDITRDAYHPFVQEASKK